MNINNSLSRKKEPFEPLHPPRVTMYTCGVTVYDDCHIGHARSLYIFSVIRDYLKYRGFTVNFVRNITDIDDKIINRANELKTDWQTLVSKYISRYYEDLQALGLPQADYEPRATENIPDMITYIEALIQKGFAYESGGDVYFNVRKFQGYGKLSGQSIDQMQAGVRVSPGDLKKDTLDFALWKRAKENEPFWESPWGKGRPGWHIECSVMSRKYLKAETLDIHAGGRDLIFPHHENELAQSESLTGQPFAKYWIHHGLLTINGQKMSKSLGNFVTIKDFLEKHKNPDFLKLFFLSAHYSHPIDYSEEKIREAKEALERIMILKEKIQKYPQAHGASGSSPVVEEIKDKFVKAMDDDFNTPQALAAVFELVNMSNKNIDNPDFIAPANSALTEFLTLLGISLKKTGSENADEENAWIEEKVRERIALKKEKKYGPADEIRKLLESKGIIVEDVKDGSSAWRRKL